MTSTLGLDSDGAIRAAGLVLPHGELGLFLVFSADAALVNGFSPIGSGLGIGRELSEGFTLALNDAGLSRQHARVELENGRAVVRDLGSKNGTFVNGARISGMQVIGHGDVLRAGQSIWVVSQGVTDGGALVWAQARAQVDNAAAQGLRVLVVGEAGSGKRTLAERYAAGAVVISEGDALVEDRPLLLPHVERWAAPFQQHVAQVLRSRKQPVVATARGSFDRELHAQVNGFTVSCPPLRARKEDILALARAVLPPEWQWTPAFAEALLRHGWADNVRGLNAAMQRVIVRARASGSQTLDQGAASAALSEEPLAGSSGMKCCPRCDRCFESSADVCPDDSARLIEVPLVPYRIDGRYRLERRLGEGGMSTVFQASDERLGRSVAVKIIRLEQSHNEKTRQRFALEGQVLARLSHPGIVNVFDSGSFEGGSRYLVMELLSGASLRELLHSHGAGSPSQVAAMLRQLGAAIAEAHRHDLVHRDIKPENVFMLMDGSVKVLDFGVALSLQRDLGLTESGAVVGTPRYMSPEQADARQVDHRTDVYSLALVVFEALTGKPAVNSNRLLDAMIAITTADVPPPSSYRPIIGPAVDKLLAHALHKDPASRPGSILTWSEQTAEAIAAITGDAQRWPSDVSISQRAASQRTRVGSEP